MPRQDRYEGLAPYYDIFIDWPKRLALEIPFIIETLAGNPTGKSCLDIGCATGRHLQRLAAEGLCPEGMEPSPHLRKLALRNLPETPVHEAGMENLLEVAERHGPWDVVTCLGNTLPHLEPPLREPFFRGLFLALKPGGSAVIHLLGYDRIMRDRPDGLLEKNAERDGHSYSFYREYSYTGDGIVFSLRVVVDGAEVASQREMLHPLTGDELLKLCSRAGLKTVALYNGFNRTKAYTADSANLVGVISR
ncbi:MAG: class I SAM-dependent methyltransferase [Candidatus Glassbacteria bacterium]|nr:class I SAM-dependent methyltransferase [Candidatus Glassbacteria bacterium]